MSGVLAGQRALVTGASSGIGAAVARAFAAEGAAVAVNHLPTEAAAADAVIDQIAQAGGRAIAAPGDVSRAEDVAVMVERASAALEGLDVLVANAGIQRDGPIVDLSLAAWQAVIGVDLTGAFLCAQAAVRQFRRQPRDPARSRAQGKVIFMSSVHEVIPWAGHANYAAAKGGVRNLMQSMAQELAPEGIRVNGIAPGAIRTNINRAAWETPAAEQALLRLIPYGRVGDPEDVGRVAVWLASDQSDYVVGTTLFVDGGMSLYPAFAHGG